MNLNDYLKGRIGILLLNIVLLMVLVIFLFSVGNTFEVIKVIITMWVLICIFLFLYDYKRKESYFNTISKVINSLDKKYLIGEIIEEPCDIVGKFYYNLMRESSKSMLEEINLSKCIQKEYKEYIEKWIHEVKTHISAIKLIEENNRTKNSSLVLHELDNIDRFVEQTLFYARSEEVDKDYLIREISLQKCINQVIIRNKQMFILNNIEVELSGVNKNVYCDSKWLEFIINQVIVNAIKYRNKNLPIIKVYTKDIRHGLKLIIEDNGIGIPQNEINRVFEKGFTGEKGRKGNNSTGIGLYLCKKLAYKLGLDISIESKVNEYTRVIIVFPRGNFSCNELLLY